MDRCRYRGEAVDGRKMENLSLFLMGEAFLSVKFYSVGEFSRNNKRGKPPLEWKCYNFRAQIKQRKGFPHGYYNKNWRNLE